MLKHGLQQIVVCVSCKPYDGATSITGVSLDTPNDEDELPADELAITFIALDGGA